MAAYRGTFVAAGQQVTDAPAGYRNSLKFTVSTAQSSLGASDEFRCLIPVEGVRAARLALGDGGRRRRSRSASGSRRIAPAVIRARCATVRRPLLSVHASRSTAPIPGSSRPSPSRAIRRGTWLTDTGVGLYLNICIAGGSSRAGTAGAWAGSDYSGGERNDQRRRRDQRHVPAHRSDRAAGHRAARLRPRAVHHAPFDQELLLCQRYLPGFDSDTSSSVILAMGSAFSTTQSAVAVPFKVPTRARPSGISVSAAEPLQADR